MSSVRRRSGQVVLSLTPEERHIVTGLVTAVRGMLAGDDEEGAPAPDTDPLAALTGMSDAPVETPDDPVLRRLLPDAYDDPGESAEFRRLTDADLRARKTEALDRVLADVAVEPPVSLDPDEGVGMWVQALNDIRLVLGTRLDVTEDWTESFESLPPDDPQIPLFLFYDWLSMLQDSLVTAVMTD